MPYSRKPRPSSSKEAELQLNREQRANWWRCEKQLKGCGRKWTGGVKEARTAGRGKERTDVEERNGGEATEE